MNFYIRHTENKDLVVKIHSIIFPADDFFDDFTNIYWVARESKSDEIAGFCQLSIEPPKHNTVFLSRAGTIKKFRGKGLHSKLIRVRERYARAHGYTWGITYTSADNIPSFVSLIRAGYRYYIPSYCYAGKPQSEVLYLRKRL
jgi:GNAT superfamily N-acetyltransferase